MKKAHPIIDDAVRYIEERRIEVQPRIAHLEHADMNTLKDKLNEVITFINE